MSIKDSTIAKVRQVPMTDVLEAEGIEFKRIGREALTLCPWHNDSSPSLTVNDDKNMCFCFACGGGSDHRNPASRDGARCVPPSRRLAALEWRGGVFRSW
jgi:hypothetical protein